MKFVTTSEGFYVSENYDRELNKKIFVFSDKLREAFVFAKKKSAQNKVDILKKYGLNAFIFSPISEEPYKDLYKVNPPESNFNSFWELSEEEATRRSVYHIEKVMMCHYSDVDFIRGVEHPTENYLTHDKALELCREKNQGLIDIIKEINTPKYDKNFGYGKICECGHEYYRHFDTYEDMEHVGCKYCSCFNFKEKK